AIVLFSRTVNYGSPARSTRLSLHDALPISPRHRLGYAGCDGGGGVRGGDAHPQVLQQRRAAAWGPAHRSAPEGLPADLRALRRRDRKSTRLNSSHGSIAYGVVYFEKNNTQE